MKKIIVSAVVIIIFALYAVFYKQSSSVIAQQSSNTTSNSSAQSSTKSTSKSSKYKNGVYIGSAADAYYGTIQVKATIANGRIADVTFLQYPNDQSESIEVNQAAMPTLKQEAITSQNANVDIVSGATQTSQAFRQSLASALSQAQ